MQKIMFNDKYGLTGAVLEGRKTMTRRIIPQLAKYKDPDISEFGINNKGQVYITNYADDTDVYPRFQIGEKIAIAQPYETFMTEKELCERGLLNSAGSRNSMFVKSSLMPHHIEITGIKVERLQDCSDDDILKEGVQLCANCSRYTILDCDEKHCFETPREAFAALIDKISGKGTWNSNPYCFCYTFELID